MSGSDAFWVAFQDAEKRVSDENQAVFQNGDFQT